MECLNTLSLDGLNPLSDVTTAVDKGTLLSTPRITNPVAGNVYVFKRGKKQWNDGLDTPKMDEITIKYITESMHVI